jgi:hypothetical protein
LNFKCYLADTVLDTVLDTVYLNPR